jgi:hypothetical protein
MSLDYAEHPENRIVRTQEDYIDFYAVECSRATRSDTSKMTPAKKPAPQPSRPGAGF